MASLLPTIPSHGATRSCKLAPERFWIPLRLSLPTVAPGRTPGALRFVSLALHILPQKGGRRRRNVSARKVSEPAHHPETHFSIARPQDLCTHRRKTHSTQQAWMYSRNQTTIASACEHRQPVFLHPTLRTRGIPLAWRRIPLRLLIPLPASTLQVFQIIRRSVLRNFGNAAPEQCLKEGAWVGRVAGVRMFRDWRLLCSFLWGASLASAVV